MEITSLCLNKKQTAQLLNLSVSGLNNLIAQDETFPKPSKAKEIRQAKAYFDRRQVELWYQKQLSSFAA